MFNDTGSIEEHEFLSSIRRAVEGYRMKSPFHFALHIDVQNQAGIPVTETGISPSLKVAVVFSSYGKEFTRSCRPSFRKGRFVNKVLVREGRNWISINKSLSLHFPVSDSIATHGTLARYWDSNGKAFNWNGLPTELKENVIQVCIHRAPHFADYFHGIPRQRSPRHCKRLPCELITRLGGFEALLSVSTQVRTITLRLCFNGSLYFDKGFCVTSFAYTEFQARMKRLAKHYQLTEPNGMPVDQRTYVLANRYKKFPKFYPELSRYATFRHGIRKLCLSFDIVSSMHFFKVSAGSFDRYWHRNYINCEVFDQLPHLNAVVVFLPNRQKEWRDIAGQLAPTLFHQDWPCPRILIRLIYERVAEVLAPYEDAAVKHFLDEEEEQRYQNLRQAAVLALKFTESELRELYADCGGGIELDEEWEVGTETSGSRTLCEEPECADKDEGFFPPRCECAFPCVDVFHL
ncbi:hypothetical protein BU26DRAFT_475060 [Trematosphaeria pertusa]|uniref:Uncharacterized protein n=1 Tax=Trematosphaeria pertusa TaxID=390896 RepID=A0A6A6IXC6_9PLEO|nr:uncharacterized protein BU26DRAFT_475060 [Trematosphaeria pertusa]KAF2254677.1 hypothetical protein BU26DRAFT_475060 [Trematosphaeria pertusa]